MPFFSVVMPTRNRASLLRQSLQSALAQTFDDYEIIVSDNHSDDDTPQVAQEATCDRLYYVRTVRALSMPDSWGFALSHARGEYILFLCDDDALRPDLLTFLFNVIRKKNPDCISWMNGVYYHPDWHEESKRNVLYIQPYTHQLIEFDSTTLLKDLFDMRLDKVAVQLPKMLNSCCHRKVFEKIKNITGKIILPQAPDYTVATAILAVIPKLLFIESPMFLGGIARKGIGANFCRRTEAFSAFYSEFDEKSSLFSHVPIASRTSANCIAESILRVKEMMPEGLKHYDLSLVNYFIQCRKEINVAAEHGNDVTAEIEEFYYALKKQNEEVQRTVLAMIESELYLRQATKAAQKSILSRLMSKLAMIRSKILNVADGKNRKVLNLQNGRINGLEGGFSNIADCAVKLSEMFPLPKIDY